MMGEHGMMKSTLTCACLIAAALGVFGQTLSYNPYLVQPTIAPAPLLPAEFNGAGTITLDVGNTGSSDIAVVAGQEMLLTLTLSYGVPDALDPIDAVGGAGKVWFSWQYFPDTKTYRGTQIATIPGSSRETITIAYRVTQNSFSDQSYKNGFNANISPPGYTNPQPTDDDTVEIYTYVQAFDFGDAPSSYGEARHEIDLRKDPVQGTYNRYIYLGSAVDPEQAMQYSPDALGDDTSQTGGLGVDDEDGVVLPVLITGTTVTIPVVVNDVDLGIEQAAPRLSGWIDWNGDGDFLDAGEPIAANVLVTASGTVNISVPVPPDAITSQPTFARFRIGTFVFPPTPTGNAAYGEVEDYVVTIQAPAPSLSVTKTKTSGPNLVTEVGQVIGYTIVITNTGNVALTGVSVSDQLPNGTAGTLAGPTGDAGTPNVIDVGEAWTYTISYTVTAADVDAKLSLVNTVSVVTTEVPGPTTAKATTPVWGGPTSVPLAGFRAKSIEGRAVLDWRTLVEFDMVGFHLERTAVSGGWERITRTIIPARAFDLQPHDYRFEDAGIGDGLGIRYRLLRVDAGGAEGILAEAALEHGAKLTVERTVSGLQIKVEGPAMASMVIEGSGHINNGPWIEVGTVVLDDKGRGALRLDKPLGDTIGFYRVREP